MDTNPTDENSDNGSRRHNRFMADTPAFIIYDPLLDPDATDNGGSSTSGDDE